MMCAKGCMCVRSSEEEEGGVRVCGEIESLDLMVSCPMCCTCWQAVK